MKHEPLKVKCEANFKAYRTWISKSDRLSSNKKLLEHYLHENGAAENGSAAENENGSAAENGGSAAELQFSYSKHSKKAFSKVTPDDMLSTLAKAAIDIGFGNTSKCDATPGNIETKNLADTKVDPGGDGYAGTGGECSGGGGGGDGDEQISASDLSPQNLGMDLSSQLHAEHPEGDEGAPQKSLRRSFVCSPRRHEP